MNQSVERILMTPVVAREFLSFNTDNYRDISPGHVQNLTAAMLRSEFHPEIPSNDAICFSADNVMTNGQHRCHAVIKSGVTIPVIVFRGGSVTSSDVMDTGRKRSAAAILAHHGFTDAGNLASVVRGYARMTTGLHGLRKEVLSNLQILGFVQKNIDLLQIAITYGRKGERAGLPRGSIGGPLYFAAAQIDVERADEFFERLSDGVGLYSGNPVYTLRMRLANVTMGHGREIDRTFVAAICIKAWNAWYTGRSLSILKWRGNNNPDEPFPEFITNRPLLKP